MSWHWLGKEKRSISGKGAQIGDGSDAERKNEVFKNWKETAMTGIQGLTVAWLKICPEQQNIFEGKYYVIINESSPQHIFE